MNLNEFETFIKKVNSNRQFKMYMHGCKDSSVANKFVKEKADFTIGYGRNNIYSTFVNCGTPNTDFVKRMQEYEYCGGFANVIMIMPSDIKIDNYCGCLEGQAGTTRGYTNPVEIDYLTFACNNTLNGENESIVNLDYVDNRLLLGYIDNETNQFVINPECILFAEQEDYDAFIKNATKSANEIYNHNIDLRILSNIRIHSINNPEEKTSFKELLRNPEIKNELIELAKFEYLFSEEKTLYDDIENSDFRNSVPNFNSILDETIDNYLHPSELENDIDDLLNELGLQLEDINNAENNNKDSTNNLLEENSTSEQNENSAQNSLFKDDDQSLPE